MSPHVSDQAIRNRITIFSLIDTIGKNKEDIDAAHKQLQPFTNKIFYSSLSPANEGMLVFYRRRWRKLNRVEQCGYTRKHCGKYIALLDMGNITYVSLRVTGRQKFFMTYDIPEVRALIATRDFFFQNRLTSLAVICKAASSDVFSASGDYWRLYALTENRQYKLYDRLDEFAPKNTHPWMGKLHLRKDIIAKGA